MAAMQKLLSEFLQEQQEPFSLDVYLLERGCCRGSNGVYLKSSQVLKKSAITSCFELVKAVLGKFLWCQNKQWAGGGNKNDECRKVSDSCSESDVEEDQEEGESHQDSPIIHDHSHESRSPQQYYMMNKRLLIDCIEGQVLEADEVWKVLCEHVWEWSQHCNMLQTQSMESTQEWNAGFEEIIVEIGDTILEAIINDILNPNGMKRSDRNGLND